MSYETGYIGYIQLFASGETNPEGGEEISDEDFPSGGSPDTLTPPGIEIVTGDIIIIGNECQTVGVSPQDIVLTSDGVEIIADHTVLNFVPAAITFSSEPVVWDIVQVSPAEVEFEVGQIPVIDIASVVDNDIAFSVPEIGISGDHTVIWVTPPTISFTAIYPYLKQHDGPDWKTGVSVLVSPADVNFSPGYIHTGGMIDIIFVDPPTIEISSEMDVFALNSQTFISVAESLLVYDNAKTGWICPVAVSCAVDDTVRFQLNVLISDYLYLREEILDNIGHTETISEILYVSDNVSIISVFQEIIEDAIDVADDTSTDAISVILLVSDYFDLRDEVLSAFHSEIEVADGFGCDDVVSILSKLKELIEDTLNADDSVSNQLILVISEYLFLRDTVLNNVQYDVEVAESIALTDTVIDGWILNLVEELEFADAVTLIGVVNETLEEQVGLQDIVSNSCHFYKTVLDYLDAVDAVHQINNLGIEDALDAADGVSSFYRAIVNLTESVECSEAITDTCWVLLTVNDTMALVDTVTTQGHFYHTIQDGVHLDVSVLLDGDVYECYVLNTPKFLPSVYSGFGFNSYCVYQGRAFGANETGIFELTGATDNGADIHTGVMTHETDFGTANTKRFRKAYLGINGVQPIMVMELEDGTKRAYNIDDKGTVEASRDIEGRKWILSVADFDELASVRLIPIVIAKGK